MTKGAVSLTAVVFDHYFFTNLSILNIMANETNDLAAALSNLINTGGTLLQQSVELMTSGLKSTSQAIEPLGKSVIELAGSATNALNQTLQSVSAAIAPKK